MNTNFQKNVDGQENVRRMIWSQHHLTVNTEKTKPLLGESSALVRQLVTSQKELNRPVRAGCAPDEPALLQRHNHIVN